MSSLSLSIDEPDAVIDALNTEDRATIAAIWRARSGMERQVAAAFSVVLRELVEGGAKDAVLALIASAIPDEIEHARMSMRLAERYAGGPVDPPPPEPLRVPELATTDPMLRATLHLVGLSCLNESIAAVRLSEEIAMTQSDFVRPLLEKIARDEVNHARAGWAHLASAAVKPAMRSEVARLLPSMLRASIEGISTENEFLEAGFPEHGLPSRSVTLSIASIAVRDVVLPGFASVGVSTRRATEWAEARFPELFQNPDERSVEVPS